MPNKVLMCGWIFFGALQVLSLGGDIEAAKGRECLIDVVSLIGCIAFAVVSYLKLTR